MSGVNKAIVVGRLGNDPETKTLSNGQTVTNLSVATSESWMDKNNGQKQERTEWHRIVIWGKLAELCSKYLSKGRQVYVEGRLQTRSWEDQQGQKRYTTEIVASNVHFLGSAPGASADAYAETSANNSAANIDNFGPEPSFDQSEEIPF